MRTPSHDFGEACRSRRAPALLMGCGTALFLLAWLVHAQGVPAAGPPDSGDGVAAVMAHLKVSAVPRWWLTLAVMCVVTAVLATLRVGSRSQPGSASDGKSQQLPPDLRSVAVLGARYSLDVFQGKVLSEKTWTETTTRTEFTGGQWQTPGLVYPPWAAPGHVSMSTATTRKDQVMLRYADGSAGAWSFTNSKLAVAPDQVISLIARRTQPGDYDCLMGYNHETRQLLTFNFGGVHSIASLASWLGATAAGAAGLVWGWQAGMQSYMSQAMPGTPASPPGLFLWAVMAGCAAVIAIVPLTIARIVVPWLRTAVFKRRYLPGIRRFLQSPR